MTRKRDPAGTEPAVVPPAVLQSSTLSPSTSIAMDMLNDAWSGPPMPVVVGGTCASAAPGASGQRETHGKAPVLYRDGQPQRPSVPVQTDPGRARSRARVGCLHEFLGHRRRAWRIQAPDAGCLSVAATRPSVDAFRLGPAPQAAGKRHAVHSDKPSHFAHRVDARREKFHRAREIASPSR